MAIRTLFIIALVILLNKPAAFANDHNDTITAIQNIKLPVLYINTIDSIMPTCDFVFAPEGAFGISTTNKTKVPGSIVLMENNEVVFDSGDYQENKSGMTIRIRGNTSAYYSKKKPYKIKLEKKGDLFGRGASQYNDKNWILIDEGGDKLYTMIGLKLNELLGLGGWTPAYRFVNVVFNGSYHGIYMLLEQIKRNADCRINISKQGYLFERDAYWWNENVYFKTQLNKEYTLKYPDEDDVTDTQLDYLKQAVDKMEQSIIDGNYEEYIDVESFALWMLAHDILGTYDSGGSNIFLTKYDNTDNTKIKMSTLWDFDSSFKTTDNWARVHYDFFYYQNLFENSNLLLSSIYKYMWKMKKEELFIMLKKFLISFRNSQEARALNQARKYDEARWNYTASTVEKNLSAAMNWFETRESWLDEHISNIEAPDYELAVKNIKRDDTNTTTHLYNLSGQQIKEHQTLKPGVYIRDGRKIIIR